jgi:Fur family transcriptional regulator, peroxide stress response regulator
MTCGSEYAAGLRARGFRMTPQRMAILHVLHHSGAHLSPTEIYSKARRDTPSLTEPTVYRTLEFLERTGLAISSQVGNGRLVYEIAGRNHDHLVCQLCGKSFEVQPEALEGLFRQLEKSSGYRFVNRHVTFFGICPKCQKIKSKKGD